MNRLELHIKKLSEGLNEDAQPEVATPIVTQEVDTDDEQLLALLDKYFQRVSKKPLAVKSEKLQELINRLINQMIGMPRGEKEARMAIKLAIKSVNEAEDEKPKSEEPEKKVVSEDEDEKEVSEDAQAARGHAKDLIGLKEKRRALEDKISKLVAKKKMESDDKKYASLTGQISSLHDEALKLTDAIKKVSAKKKKAMEK